MTEQTDVVIIGSGPYGLSLAAHLRARRVSFRIFGPALKFWREMPDGVNLKSLGFATNIFVPEKGHTYPEWCRERGLEDFEPCTMRTFAEYARGMQLRFVPELEEVLVTNVKKAGERFDVTLATGRQVSARSVVVCTGLTHLANRPDVLTGLPPTLARHSSEISDYSQFRGKTVAVIGGGSSAIEAGALVREAGGTAEVFVRGKEAEFNGRSLRKRPILQRFREPLTVLGSGRRHYVLQHFPLLVHFLPKHRRIEIDATYLGASSPWWIKDRVVGKVPIHVLSEVVSAETSGDRLRVRVRGEDQSMREMEFDHLIAGTGYKFEVARLAFLDQGLRRIIGCTKGAPSLDVNFQSSVKGLYFIGPLSAMSFGPLFRFVAGAKFTVRSLSRHLAWRFARPKTAPAIPAGVSPAMRADSGAGDRSFDGGGRTVS